MVTVELHGRGPNVLSSALLEEIEGTLDDAGEEAIVLKGKGRAFSAGLDLDELKRLDETQLGDLLQSMGRVARKLFLHPGPTLALVNGHAVAGGCLLAQCCDIRLGVDDPNVKLGMTGLARGLEYPPFVFAVLKLRLAPTVLDRVLLGSETFAPRDALALGLLDRVEDAAKVDDLVDELLTERLALSAAAYASTKLELRSDAMQLASERMEVFIAERIGNWRAALS